MFVQDYSGASFLQLDNTLDVLFVIGSLENRPIVKYWLVCYTAVFSVVTQRFSPTAVYQTKYWLDN